MDAENDGYTQIDRLERYEECIRHVMRLGRLGCIALLALRSDLFADAVGEL